jgi:hypothetical protein
MWEKVRQDLRKKLDDADGRNVVEHSNALNYTWLSFNPSAVCLRLSDKQVQVGLQLRTLCRSTRSMCKCGVMSSLEHIMACTRTQSKFGALHEAVREPILQLVRSIPDTHIHNEPMVEEEDGSRRGRRALRTDYRVMGPPGAFGSSGMEVDHKLRDSGTNEAKAAYRRVVHESTATPLERREKELLRLLEQAECDKNAKYQGRTQEPFFPLVMTTRGYFATKTASKMFGHWKELTNETKWRWFTARMSTTLIRIHTRYLGYGNGWRAPEGPDLLAAPLVS